MVRTEIVPNKLCAVARLEPRRVHRVKQTKAQNHITKKWHNQTETTGTIKPRLVALLEPE